MRALVTGGAGFIGSHLVDSLIARGDSVVVLDDLSTGRRDNLSHHVGNPHFRAVYLSVLDTDIVEELVREVDVVFHLAAAVGVKYIIENPLHSMRVNVRGTENVLESADRHGTKVILFSTSEIYGKSQDVPFREDADRLLGPPTIHRWSYSTAKAVDEILGLGYHEERDLPVLILRCFNTCGPRQRGRYGMVVPRFVEQAIQGGPITVYGDGSQTRCFGSVFDVVDGVLALLDCDRAVGEIFNVGNNEEGQHPGARRASPRPHRERCPDRVRPLRPGLRARLRGHAAENPRSHEDPGLRGLPSAAHPRRHPAIRHREPEGDAVGRPPAALLIHSVLAVAPGARSPAISAGPSTWSA